MASLTHIEILLPELRAYAVAICSSRDDAEDLVQDAIERALRAEGRPRVLDELRPWMFRVIRNLHHDELRKKRVRGNIWRLRDVYPMKRAVRTRRVTS